MEIVLGVSMTPATVRMVVVEGEKADGVIVDHEVFDIAASDDEQLDGSSDQVIAAILGTCESAAEGGHHLISTGVTWSDRTQAAILRHELAALNIEDVTFVSELHAAEALAQAVCGAAGYERCALMFVESDTATLSVVESANGSIIKVQSQGLEGADAVAELAAMVAGLEELQPQPQGLFLVGSGVNVRALKPRIEMATSSAGECSRRAGARPGQGCGASVCERSAVRSVDGRTRVLARPRRDHGGQAPFRAGRRRHPRRRAQRRQGCGGARVQHRAGRQSRPGRDRRGPAGKPGRAQTVPAGRQRADVRFCVGGCGPSIFTRG